MIKLKNLLLEIKGLNPEDAGFSDFWLSPDGLFYKSDGDHENWAEEYQQTNIEGLLNKGWARLVREQLNGRLIMHIDAIKLSEKQKESLRIWFALHSDVEELYQENYHKKMSDDEKYDLANQYFSVGQDDDESRYKNYCWIWDGDKIIAKKGGTHGINFSHEVAERNFKGWYDIEQNKISIVFPKSELRKLGDRRPTVDDIPQIVYQKLINKFGKKPPTFVVFEMFQN